MKKTTVIIISAVLAAAVAAGCSGGSNDSESSKAAESTASASESGKSSETGTETSTETSSETESSDASKAENSKESSEGSKSESGKESSEGSKSESGKESSESSKTESSKESTKTTAAITYNNVEITMGAELSGLLEKLGTPDHKETIEAEEEIVEAYSYTFDNMTLYSCVRDKKETVTSVSVSGEGSAATADGIKIGSTTDEVANIYGKVTDDSSASFEIGNDVFVFVFEDGKVSNISLIVGLGDE